MSVFISDKDTAKLYVHFLDQNNLKSKYLGKNDLIYIRDFESVQKNSQSCIIRFKNSRLRLKNTLLLVFKTVRHDIYQNSNNKNFH